VETIFFFFFHFFHFFSVSISSSELPQGISKSKKRDLAACLVKPAHPITKKTVFFPPEQIKKAKAKRTEKNFQETFFRARTFLDKKEENY